MSTQTLDRDAAITGIKAALKRRSKKSWSVTGGKGTAWGWIEIDAPPKRRTWQYVSTKTPEPPEPGAIYAGSNVTPQPYLNDGTIKGYEDDPWSREVYEAGGYIMFTWEVNKPDQKYGHMGPDDRKELAELLGLEKQPHHQGISIAASSDYRREYLARAEGKTPEVYGERYWD